MNRHKLYILAFIVAVAIFTLATVGHVWADTGRDGADKKELAKAESYFQQTAGPVIEFPEKFQVFDKDLNLVYESPDKKDRKLKNLMAKSDFLAEINNTHIYQLSR
ncbi:MAG TPA: hypothetical protein VI583_05040 [Cyclobacteriaceae bacterium]|nr:hypothetical protein [Cyclobacteriaceae bacterium]